LFIVHCYGGCQSRKLNSANVGSKNLPKSVISDKTIYTYVNALEADIIIRLRSGKWAAVEVKLGNREIEEAAKHLLALKARIDEEKMGEASFLMIITGGPFAYRRNDGIWVVPIGCLRN